MAKAAAAPAAAIREESLVLPRTAAPVLVGADEVADEAEEAIEEAEEAAVAEAPAPVAVVASVWVAVAVSEPLRVV